MRNPILGMASHDLSNTKTTILGATPGAIPGIDGNTHDQVQKKHAKKFSIKNFGAPKTPPLEILHVGLFPVFRREKSYTKGGVSAQILYVYAPFFGS